MAVDFRNFAGADAAVVLAAAEPVLVAAAFSASGAFAAFVDFAGAKDHY